MKFSALIKPTEEVNPPCHIVGQHFNPHGMALPNDEADIEVSDDDDEPSFEQQLVIAVDYIRQMQNYLGFIYQNNAQHQWLGEKAENNLQELVEEVEDFLGEYTT
jgi:hypothetical protein